MFSCRQMTVTVELNTLKSYFICSVQIIHLVFDSLLRNQKNQSKQRTAVQTVDLENLTPVLH